MRIDPVREHLAQALAVSVALHAVLLLSVPPVKPTPGAAEPSRLGAFLTARTSSPAAPLVQAAPAVTAARHPSGPARVLPLSRARPEPRLAVAGAAAAPLMSVPPPGEALAPQPEKSPPLAALAAPAIEAGAGSAAGSVAPSADDLRQYRVGLAVNARRYKHYPALAREAGWEGTVEIAVSTIRSSGLPEVSLVRSSGRSILDQEALAMINKASVVTRMPDGLKGREFRVLLPIEFALEADR